MMRLRSSVARWGGELLIVFLGVSGAFFAENVRESIEQRELARRMYAALADEISDHIRVGERILGNLGAGQEEWEAARERGEFPAPPITPVTAGQPPRSAWRATLASGGVSLIEGDLFYQLSKYYDGFEVTLVPLVDTDPFAQREIIPFVNEGSARFYRDGSLRPEYARYVQNRRALLRNTRLVLDMAKDELLPELQRRAGA